MKYPYQIAHNVIQSNIINVTKNNLDNNSYNEHWECNKIAIAIENVNKEEVHIFLDITIT